ncbi:hypothetical protein K491DRAFT_589607 [Lophiostoma macrostomum CBS 122681]|uniref:Low temperature requirement A n=1 Tax=Lophiostoma macrostomum CBS 122681 TaxID=1314788 RepID=A0A6A6TNL0_9PLEO|nr:hypothetical protein K491DRAFT_589607 [Lophiostoma macrostomum CBS 122681]
MSSTPQTLVGTDTPASTHQSHHHPHLPHLHHTGKRLRQFLRPDGRKVHVAGSPDEADLLRKTLSSTEKPDEFDLVINGSPEHIEALRHTHAHHEDKYNQVKEEHGDIVLEFEQVIRELDALSAELHFVSDHAVQLDANFSKYGYSAHLRTKEDSPEGSRSPSLHGDGSSLFNKEQWASERKLGETMRFWQKPIVRQYFHKGLLWRAREAQEVASYELFIDLFYVGIIAITGDHAVEHPDAEQLRNFIILFAMSWKFWSDIALLISWFDSDDILRRCSVLFILTCLLGFTTNVNDAFSHTYAPLVGFYLAARLFIAVSLLWYGFEIRMVRGAMITNGIAAILPAGLWIASIHVEGGARQGLIWPALFLDIFGGTATVLFARPQAWMGKRWNEWMNRCFEFVPGANIEHRIERTGAFVTLVFGSSVLGILYQSSQEFGINAFFGKAVLGLIQAFTFNWIYFEIDSWNLHSHAIRRHIGSAMVWFSIHIPFIMSFVLSASALAVLVRAHDCPDTPLDSLYETYVEQSEEHISEGLRWFYCGGMGIALLCMTIIAVCHTHKKPPRVRVGKHKRLTIRVFVSIAIILLPLAHMNSLDLIGTTTGLLLFMLLVELYGASCTGDNLLWDKKCKRGKCRYDARCGVSKKDLEASLKKGEILKVEELARKGGGEKGVVAVY